MDKSDIPDLAKAPASLLEALENHLGTLENKKVGGASSATNGAGASGSSSSSKYVNFKLIDDLLLFYFLKITFFSFICRPPSSVTNAINSLSSNVSLSNEEKRKVIEEEAKTLETFKVSRHYTHS